MDNNSSLPPQMPTVSSVSNGEMPGPAINIAPPKQKISPVWIISYVVIGLIAIAGIILTIVGLNLPASAPKPEAPRAVEVVVEDCVGKKPDNIPTSEGEQPGAVEQPPATNDKIPSSSRTYAGENCTLTQGPLMLINPVFQVKSDYIAARKRELVDLTRLYQIKEGVRANGTPLLDAEAAVHLSAMIKAYQAAYPKHTIETRSCFRSAGTNCGRLCYATGTTDHHTGYTCDLIDPSYGKNLNTDDYDKHLEWQWLKDNSYKYGFIDRFPAAWAGGSMDEPVNINDQGSTGLYETWHYRYVGVDAATEIATGKYNNGQYDSLEHYLKARGIVDSLTAGTCRQ